MLKITRDWIASYVIISAGCTSFTSCWHNSRYDHSYCLSFGNKRLIGYFVLFLFTFIRLQLYFFDFSYPAYIVSSNVSLSFSLASAVVFSILFTFLSLRLVIFRTAFIPYLNILTHLHFVMVSLCAPGTGVPGVLSLPVLVLRHYFVEQYIARETVCNDICFFDA